MQHLVVMTDVEWRDWNEHSLRSVREGELREAELEKALSVLLVAVGPFVGGDVEEIDRLKLLSATDGARIALHLPVEEQ